MRQFVRQKAAVGNQIELVCGVGEILAPSYFAVGVNAFTSGIVNFAPRASRTLLNMLQEHKLQEAAKFVETNLIPVFELRRKRKGYATTVIKEAMNLCG
jgi:5-dehydro-4-deoxyglucarate dehydratase